MVKFRAVSEADRPEVEAWIAADPVHSETMHPDFFLVPGKTYALYALGDEAGTAMYVHQAAEGMNTRMYIQFGPDRKRIMQTFREGFPLVAADAKSRNFKAIVFDSKSPALIKWMMGEFGFKAELKAVL